ncbi:hypothetical protein [Halorarius halobius]|uniref:hypothetical protein n=1 Tax=Halorarius halobius TaxID=2962671 RepID=UPI0020CB9F7A|nr:hypothetical protein [Halorarius halobius]
MTGRRSRDRSRRRGSEKLTRRRVLGGLVGGAGVLSAVSLSNRTGAFSSATAGRSVAVSVADDPNALVGLDINGAVKKNSTDRLVTVTNDTSSDVTVTVSLDFCTQGTLYYDPAGTSGCSVSFSLAVGGSGTVDIEAAVKDTTIPFTLDVAGSGFSFTATRSTTAESGNVKGAVTVKKVKKFSANLLDNNWTVQQVDIRDGDGDADLDRVEYEVTDSGGTVRGTQRDTASGDSYSRKKNEVVIEPDSGYILVPGETYTLTVTGYDADGNSASVTRTDTA